MILDIIIIWDGFIYFRVFNLFFYFPHICVPLARGYVDAQEVVLGEMSAAGEVSDLLQNDEYSRQRREQQFLNC